MFRVLLPVDDEERGMKAARSVVALPKAKEAVHVTVLNVEEKEEIVDDTIIRSEEWYDEDEIPESVERVRGFLEEKGITVETRREHADPARAIIEVADEISADSIVMAGRKRTPVGKVLFGSVTQPVLLDSEIPVTVANG